MTYLVMKLHLEPLRAKFWCIPSTYLYQEELQPSTTLLLALARASAVYHIASGAHKSFGRQPPLLLAPTRASAVYHSAFGASMSFCCLPPLLLAPTRASAVYDLPCGEGAP
jgi:hypothetical protein